MSACVMMRQMTEARAYTKGTWSFFLKKEVMRGHASLYFFSTEPHKIVRVSFDIAEKKYKTTALGGTVNMLVCKFDMGWGIYLN